MGQKQKTEERERKKERLNDGDNNGQATHGARKPPGPKEYVWLDPCCVRLCILIGDICFGAHEPSK